MTKEELSEIKKRMKYKNPNISRVVGCFVSSGGEIQCRFHQDIEPMGEETGGHVYSMFKKVLNGVVGEKAMDINIPESGKNEAHKLLLQLREDAGENEDMLNILYENIISEYTSDTDYVIMLVFDTYDVPVDAPASEGDEDFSSDEVFRYMVCCVCPVKNSKAVLSFSPSDNKFKPFGPGVHVAAPEAGFMFPTFDGRGANTSKAFFYAKKLDDALPLSCILFGTRVPEPVTIEQQKKMVAEMLKEDIPDDTDDIGFYQELSERLDAFKEDGIPIDSATLGRALCDIGMEQDAADEFVESFEETFGEDSDVPFVSDKVFQKKKTMEVTADDVVIRLPSEKKNLIETRVIDGVKCIVIRAEGDVHVDGFPINIE